MKRPDAKKIRYAVLGLGWFAQESVLPAFANAQENSELAALVSGDEEKRLSLAEKYGVPGYSYEEYDKLLSDGQVDAVYIVSPNSEHHPHTLTAAQHGVHVLCEKPLADTTAACREMIDACQRAGVLLMTAYRLHFEEANLSAIETIKSGKLGQPRLFESVFTQEIEEGNTRLEGDLGGSPLLDLGIYCINASRYLFRAEPVEVSAFAVRRPDPRFAEVPEMVSAILRFPQECLGMITCGFGEAKVSTYRMVGTKGDLRLEPAFGHKGQLASYLTVDGKTQEKTYKDKDQVAPEIVYFSNCILNSENPEPDGVEGLIDVAIMEAIEQSYSEGKPVKLEGLPKKERPDIDQKMHKPAQSKPELVKASSPGKK